MATRKIPVKAAAGKAPTKRTTASRTRSAASVVAPARPKAAATAASAAATPRMRAARKSAAATISAEQRYVAIAHAAYLRAEQRGFAPGHEIDDWLAAEAEFDAANKPAAD